MQNNTDIRSVSKSLKEHRFFDRLLSNDLQILSSDLLDRYKQIESSSQLGASDVWKASNSISTIKWKDYNVFQFHSTEIYNLYKAVRDMTKEACEYYELDFDKQNYMLQGWFNINYSKNGKLDWHDHGPQGAPTFHGYYCVNAEPSITHYRVFDKDVENLNVNNRAILSEMGHPHAMADWDWDGPRITIAYDLIPLENIKRFAKDQEQHWIPLC